MTMSIRKMPLLALMIAGAACGSDDGATGLIPGSDAGSFEDRAAEDDARSNDGASPTDDTSSIDAPPRTDAGSRADGATGMDGSSRSDGMTRPDAANPDGPTGIDANGDGSIRVDGGSDAGPPTTPDAPIDSGLGACVGTVDTEFLREKLSKLSGAMPVDVGDMQVTISERNSAGNRALARQFLTAEYEALGFAVTEHMYATGVNLIAQKPGADGKFLILSAHYDSIKDTVAGADDDGSGVIAGLATAKALQTCKLDHGLRILAFDEEEDGLLGSKAYVSQLQSNGELADLIGDVQLEMLGYHTKQDGGFLLVDCKSAEGDRPESKFLNDAVLSAISLGGFALQPHDACTTSSDHSPFWTAGKPAIVYSQEFFFAGADSTPCYHKDCDKIDQINFDYYTKLTTLSVAVAASLVGAH